jgi:alpha,alpha-trehalose-phosphate synthase [UDP-forming]
LRTTLKLVLPLAISVVCISALYATYQVRKERRNSLSDLARNATVLAENLQESIEASSARANSKNLQHVVERFGQREHLLGVAIYDLNGKAVALTPGLDQSFASRPDAAARAEKQNAAAHDSFVTNDVPLYVNAVPLHTNNQTTGTLAVIYDTNYIDRRVLLALRDAMVSALIETILITGLAFILVKWNFTAPLANTANWLRSMRAGAPPSATTPVLPQGEFFDQIHHEVKHLTDALHTARAAAQEEAQLRDTQSSVWTAERLGVSLRSKLADKPLFVVSNREPYMHVLQENKSVQVIVPASGLVTALEPVLQACHGTWIANGSGSADRQSVDSNDRLEVPPDHPSYTLRRVWLTREDERGYYEGFSNEGMWPLCHIAHTRPTFRPEDWLTYQQINRRFADAVLKEMESVQTPLVFVQDYHFALLPRMIKEARPDARVAIFWHIPWPNPEVFGICPWQRELVEGLLGADLVGFHIQTHCNNFIGTVDHALEALTDWDRFEVNRQGHVTRVRPYPISVAFSSNGQESHPYRSAGEERAALCNELNVECSLMGVGVDRVDYTKGILERFRGIERFLELHPAYHRRFSFVEIAAPSRTDVPRYQQFLEEVVVEAERVNARFQTDRWKPIVLLKKHHSHKEIERYYRAANVCLVTSLHDGMNLVAKEFIAAREDERGTLILSTFTGAAQELSDALLVNPYDVDQVAQAIYQSLEFDEEEQARRMVHMRKIVLEHNVYRWAANVLSDLTEIRIDTQERTEVAHAQ